MAADDGDPLPVGWLVAGAIGLVLVFAVVIWFVIPGPSASHRFTSPEGRVTLEIRERCAQTCERSIVAETVGVGTPVRKACHMALAQTHPVLLNAYPLWSGDERAVEIVYADSEGQGGKFALDIARDCTLTPAD